MKHVILREQFSGLDHESKVKRYRELWQQATRYDILTDFPLHLDLELSGRCNLSCTGCFQDGMEDDDRGLMEPALFRKIIDEGVAKGLCAIKLQIRGESLLHPDFFELARYAKEKGVLDIQLTTNATLIRDETIDKLLDCGIDGIIFSVDARHEEASERSTLVKDYDVVPKVVTAFLERRKELGLAHPWVRIQASVHKQSPEKSMEIKKRMERDYPLADVYLLNRIFNVFKDQDSFPDLHSNYELLPCVKPMQRLSVFWNGRVTICCMDYNADFNIGDANKDDIETIWRSKTMQWHREAHASGKRPSLPICKHCLDSLAPKNDQTFIDNTPANFIDYTSGTQRK